MKRTVKKTIKKNNKLTQGFTSSPILKNWINGDSRSTLQNQSAKVDGGKQKLLRGFTCGAFDLMHAGHHMMFKEAKKKCDQLVVFLQTDPSIDSPEYRGKQKNKPIQSLKERRIQLEGCRYVDDIIVYSTEADLYKKLKKTPLDIRIIGSDWRGKKYTGHDLPIKVYFNSRDHGFSTTELRERIAQAEMVKKNA